jgi:hypothetical protein
VTINVVAVQGIQPILGASVTENAPDLWVPPAMLTSGDNRSVKLCGGSIPIPGETAMLNLASGVVLNTRFGSTVKPNEAEMTACQ